jgi:hypothetical protein
MSVPDFLLDGHITPGIQAQRQFICVLIWRPGITYRAF